MGEACFAQPSKVAAPSPAQIFFGDTSAHIGMVDRLAQQEAAHIFTLTNASNKSVELTSIRGSCGCEHLAYLVNGQERQSFTALPGETFSVQMRVRLSGQPAMDLTKTAWLIGSHGDILTTLSLSFKVRSPYVVKPLRLDLGNVPAEGSKSALFTVQVDKALLPTGQFPAFETDTDGVTAKLSGPISQTNRDGKPSFSANFLVTAANLSKVGSLNANLHFVLKSSTADMETVSIPITGSVAGDFAVSPMSISFGVVSTGSRMARELVLTGISAEALKHLRVISGSKYIDTQVIPSDGSASVVRVVLSGKPPDGPFQTALVFKYGESQSLTIPIRATIVAAY